MAEHARGADPGLWMRQLREILRVEVWKILFGWRSLPIYLLSGLPLLILMVLALFPPSSWEARGVGVASMTYAWIYQTFILRAVIFFGCVGIFTNLFRGDLLDRSLHYYFLSPVRRELLVAGKYLAGLGATAALFLSVTLLTNLLVYVPFGAQASAEYLVDGPGLGQLGSYLGVTLLACVGYGAVFLTLGLLFRNPILPAVVILAWELLVFLMPPLLKRISVIHYLEALCPVPLPEGPFALLAEPPPAWMSVGGLLVLALLVLAGAGLKIRHLEILYADD